MPKGRCTKELVPVGVEGGHPSGRHAGGRNHAAEDNWRVDFSWRAVAAHSREHGRGTIGRMLELVTVAGHLVGRLTGHGSVVVQARHS